LPGNALKELVVTTVLICEDRRGVREELARVMSSVVGVERVGCVANGQELLFWYSRRPVDLVLVGAHRALPAGPEATERLLGAHPRATVIVFGGPEDIGGITAAIAAGAAGYLRWDAPRTAAEFAESLGTLALAPPARARGAGPALSSREIQVLVGMSQGRSNGQIGKELFLSEDTIKTHSRRIFRKLGANDRAQAVAHGFRHGLVF
jgi:DNA-binding NarL/FixJ family response regulator